MLSLMITAIGMGLVMGTAGRAPLLLAGSGAITVAALVAIWSDVVSGSPDLWPFIKAWLVVAALQVAFVAGAWAQDVHERREAREVSPAVSSSDLDRTA
ncbi:hypothetical protein [Alsobacter sp. R-9]